MATAKTKKARRAAKVRDPNNLVVVKNRRAFHDYHIDATFEAGLALLGTEVKSIRAGRVNLTEGFVRIINREAWLWNVHISPYQRGGYVNHEPTRARKLLAAQGPNRHAISAHSDEGTNGHSTPPLPARRPGQS